IGAAASNPTIANAANITVAGMRMDSGATLTVNGTGKLTLADSSGTKNSEFNGTITGNGTVTIGAGHAATWSSGEMSGGGTTQVLAGGQLTMTTPLSGAVSVTGSRTLSNLGVVVVAPNAYLTMYSCSGSPSLVNSGTLQFAGDSSFAHSNF